MLHGYGSHELDLLSFASELPSAFSIVSVRAPHSLGFGGFAWYEINFDQLGKGKMSNIPQARESRDLLHDFIQKYKLSYGKTEAPVWLMGFSQGAILSYGLALQYPKNYGSVLALSGYILKDLVPEQYRPADLRHLDFLVTHGTHDPVLPVAWARQSVDMLEQLQVKHQYREYPMAHGINPECFADIKRWISGGLSGDRVSLSNK